MFIVGDTEQIDAFNCEADWIDIPEKQPCIFCNRFLRKTKKSNQKVTTTTTSSKKNQIFNILRILNEDQVLADIENSSSISYHIACFSELEYKHVKSRSLKKATVTSDWASKRSIHAEVFTKIAKNINETLIEKGQVRSLSEIYDIYKAIFEEEKLKSNSNLMESVYHQHHLLRKILEQIPTLTKTVYKNRTFIHRADLTLKDILKEGFDTKEDWANQIKAVAFHIRQCIMNMRTRPLPKKNITLQDILCGECDIPVELNLLIGTLLKGPNGSKSTRKEKRIDCICHSIMFSMSNGSIKPATTLYLGLAMKSLTGSRKIVDILNRMGYSISYTVVEELETELAYGCSILENTLPSGLIPNQPELRTHLAFDNYDRFVETSSGKDTLHDTVGIVFQNIAENLQVVQIQDSSEQQMPDNLCDKRRRNYQSNFDSSVEPYQKGNETTPTLIGDSPTFPLNLERSVSLDNIWMFHHALCSNNRRWFAWNSERIIDRNPLQKIGYLPNIDMSPTSDAAVKKTLEIAQCVAKDCNQQNIIVTFDLAIAKKAYQIQTDLSPKFDNVFITMGAFHTQLSYFKVSFILCTNLKLINYSKYVFISFVSMTISGNR